MTFTPNLIRSAFWRLFYMPRGGWRFPDIRFMFLWILSPMQILFESPRISFKTLFDFLAPPDASRTYAIQAEVGNQFSQGRGAGRQALMALALAHLPESAKQLQWLELGCCDGLNLMALEALGVEKLMGIELNSNFIAAGKAYAPKFFATADVRNISIEAFCAQGDHTDITFTCNVLQHVSPSNNAVFAQIAALTRLYIVTVESERQCNPIHFPRNYGRLFEKLGFRQVHEEFLVEQSGHLPEGLMWNHFRVLKKIDFVKSEGDANALFT